VSWPLARLGELGRVVTGSTPKASDSASSFGTDVPFVTPGDLDKVNPLINAERYLTREAASTARLLPKGAVLISCIGNLGKIAITGTEVVTNQQINAVVFDDRRIFPGYGYYACRLLKRTLESIAPATTLPIVSKSKFEALTIPVPPLDVQRRIAAILDQAEELIAKRRAAIALLDQLPQAIFLDMFSYAGAKWSSRTLGDLSLETRYGTSNKSGPTGYQTLRIPNVLGGSIDTTDMKTVEVTLAEFNRLRLIDGDILFVRTNGNPDYVGRCAVFRNSQKLAGDCIYASYLIRLRPRLSDIDSVYLREFLLGESGRRQLRSNAKTSAGQYNINAEGISVVQVPVPPLELQQHFAERLEAVHLARISHQSALAQAEVMLASLQGRCFGGPH